MRNLLSLFFGMKFCDTSSLKDIKQFVIVSNHNSHIDTMTILSSLGYDVLHRVHPVASGDYFAKNKVIGWLVKKLVNALFVYKKTNKGKGNLAYLDQHMKEGKSLIIYPEGTRGKPDDLAKFKTGIGVLLADNPQVTVVPVFLDGAGKMMPRGDGIPLPTLAYFKMGTPFSVEGMNVEEINNRIYEEVTSLKGEKDGLSD